MLLPHAREMAGKIAAVFRKNPVTKRKLHAVTEKSHAFKPSKRFYIAGVSVLFIISFLTYGYYWYTLTFGSSYSATLTYQMIDVQESRVVTLQGAEFSPTALNSVDSLTVSASATGEKPTGERSKGTISIFNATTDAKSLKAGTAAVCTTSACTGLQYALDVDVVVSAGASVEAAVTAADIGENYNLPAGGGRFKLAQYDSKTEVLASNIKPIAGGTPKKMVKILLQKDIKTAEQDALKNLKEVLVESIKSDQANAQYLIPTAEASWSVEKIETTSDLPENSEAEFANITVSAKATVMAYPKSSVEQYIEALKREITPEGYTLDEKNSSLKTDLVNQKKDSSDLSITYNARATPKVDLDALKKNLAGKTFDSAENILAKVPYVVQYTQDVQPKSFPRNFWKVPENVNKIDVKITFTDNVKSGKL